MSVGDKTTSDQIDTESSRNQVSQLRTEMSQSPTRGFFNKAFRFPGNTTHATWDSNAQTRTTHRYDTSNSHIPPTPSPSANSPDESEPEKDEDMASHETNDTTASIDSIAASMSQVEIGDPGQHLNTEASQVSTIDKTTSSSTAQAPLSLSTILHEATSLAPIPRFIYLLTHTTKLIQAHAPYHINTAGHITCTSTDGSEEKPRLTEKRFVRALAVAQDSMSTAQPAGPAFEHLKIFKMLWSTTIPVIEMILQSNVLVHEVFGWGMYGMSAGYREPDELFLSHKQRLHEALTIVRNLHLPVRDRGLSSMVGIDRMHELTRARRSLHICAIMLLQTMRKDWERVRWGIAIRVCERWLAHLGWGLNGGPGAAEEVKRQLEGGEGGVGVWVEEEGLWSWKMEELKKKRARERRLSLQ